MKIGTAFLFHQDQTGAEMRRLVKNYWKDLGNYIEMPLNNFFEFVKRIPYTEDNAAEIIARPGIILNSAYADCKKKAILLASWAEAHGIPWRFLAISERPDKQIHHVFPQFKINGIWKNIDATYPEFVIFEGKPNLTRARII